MAIISKVVDFMFSLTINNIQIYKFVFIEFLNSEYLNPYIFVIIKKLPGRFFFSTQKEDKSGWKRTF